MTCIHAGALSGLSVILNLFTLGLHVPGACPVRPSLSKPMKKGLGFPCCLPTFHIFISCSKKKRKEKKREALKKKSVHYHVVIMARTNPSTKAKPTRLETAQDPLAWLTSHH